MRNPADDASGQRDAGPRSGSGHRAAHGHRSASRRGAEEPPSGGESADTDRFRSSRYWPSVADAAPGKGPVRGYPPAPGQPPPLYPPGEFAAWNQRRDGAPGVASPWADPAGHGGLADQADHSGPPAVPAGPAAGPAGPLNGRAAVRPGSGQRGGRHSQPARRLTPGGTSLSRYYAGDADNDPDPGYPVLAVSDPAADVTSTQTWRAIAEGRSTGIWAAPAGLRATGGNSAVASRATSARSGPHAAPGSGPNSGPHTGPVGPRSGPRTAPRSGPHATVQPTRSAGLADTDASPVTGRMAGRVRGRAATRTASPGRRRPASVHLSMVAAAVLVVAAASVLGYYVVHMLRSHPRPAAQSSGRTSPSAAPSASLGPFGHIETRQSDPQPLTIAQLYPASYTINGLTVTSVVSSLGTDCSGAITGATLQTAVSWADCSQVARATYLSPSQGLMGTIGVLNLSTAAKAKTAWQSADANDFISQLPGAKGPTQSIGQGTGIEEAAAKGHYLILIWAQIINLAKPNAAQTTELESFMTGLLQNTANVSLSKRLLTGTP